MIQPPSTITPRRLTGLDALRGIAVLLMVEQHLGRWLWNPGFTRMEDIMNAHPFMTGFNALGGLAAPLFILLAGAGVALLGGRVSQAAPGGPADSMLMRRGLLLLAFGYALNFFTPHWFSPGSWYVLHLIGAALMVSPQLLRLPSPALIFLGVAVLAATPLVQTGLDTPSLLNNSWMRDTSLPGGILRLALAEGQFPLLPWLAMFAAGLLAGRWIEAMARRKTVWLAAGSLGAAAVLAGLGFVPGMADHPLWSRALFLTGRIYPVYPPLLLALMGAALVLFLLFTLPRMQLAGGHPLVALGRASLSILFFHLILFREGSEWLGVYRQVPTLATCIIQCAALGVITLLATLWGRVGYRYGLEWLMRKIAG